MSPRQVKEGYCPTCRTKSLLSHRGECLWCDTVVLRDGPVATRRHAGIPVLMQEDVVEEAKRLYDTGRSLRSIARELVERTDYSSEASMVMALSTTFKRRGWAVRARVEQVVMQSTKHGLLKRKDRNRAYVRLQRIKRGEIQNQRCQGVRTQYPHKGEQCSRPARLGSDYCYAHDPAERERIVKQCAQMREARAA